ncbi:uncharacterized protein LOC135133658 [Zophobas morio]|uniref:uncharacterized protein LOC135133658 n=1 Tax=Zophobas morio TaxID=2755281 RepID=UPI00308284BD
MSYKKKNKRKQSPSSEDFIESSQAPVAGKSCLKNKFRGFRQTTIEESMQVLQPENDAETEMTDFENKVKPLRISKTRRFSLTEPSSQKVDIGKRLKRSRSLEKLDFASELITFSLEKVTKEEVHVNDTSLDTLTCDSIPSKEETPTLDSENLGEVDTLTLSPVRSPTKQDLPGSPVTCDTPERTTELLNNTSDISPISSTSEVATPKQATNEVSNRRVARLLQMVNSNVQVSTEGRRWFGNKVSSPSSGRIRKIRMKKEENLDILTFSREVPSPLTVPASGILKRKFNNVDEVATPSPKRKRVNFSDPAITDKKLFIKDAEEYEIDQKTYSTNESQVDEADDLADTKKTKEFLDGFERDSALLTFRDFCDSNFKNTSLDDTKTALKHLLHNLQVPEVMEIITDYLGDDEIKNTLTNESCEQIVDRFVVPLVENVINFEDFLPKLLKVVEKLPNDRLQRFIDDVTAVFGDRINHSISAKLTQEQVEEHVLSLSCDKVHDLMKTYCSNLEQQQRNEFLVGLMNLASDELPFNKEFLNSHVTILQNFVSKMTD